MTACTLVPCNGTMKNCWSAPLKSEKQLKPLLTAISKQAAMCWISPKAPMWVFLNKYVKKKCNILGNVLFFPFMNQALVEIMLQVRLW